MSPLTDPIGPDLTATLRALKLGKLTATLPERLTLARQHNMPHADFLQLILSDEVARREAGSIALRARNAGLDPAMRTETWDPTAAIRYDQRLWPRPRQHHHQRPALPHPRPAPRQRHRRPARHQRRPRPARRRAQPRTPPPEGAVLLTLPFGRSA